MLKKKKKKGTHNMRKNIFKTTAIAMAVLTMAIGMTACGNKTSDTTDTQSVQETKAVVDNSKTVKASEQTSKTDSTTESSKENTDSSEETEDTEEAVEKEDVIVANEDTASDNTEVINTDTVNEDSGNYEDSYVTDNSSNDNNAGADNTVNTPDTSDTSDTSSAQTPTEAPTEAPTQAPTEAPTTARATKTVTKKVIYYEQDNVTVFDTDSITYVAYVDTGLPVTPTYYTGDTTSMPKCTIPDHMNVYWMKTTESVHAVGIYNSVEYMYAPETGGVDVSKYPGDIKLYPGWI